MPALQCAVSPDGRYLAVRRGMHVALHLTETRAVVAERALASEDGTLVFAGGLLIEHAVERGRTIVTGYSMAKLAQVASCEIPVESALAGETGKYLLLPFDDSAHVVHVQPHVISYGPMRAAGRVQWAVGCDHDELLVSSARGLEMWSAESRRPLRHVSLELPPPRAVGSAAHRKTLWVTTATRPELLRVRLSDGESTIIPVAAPPRETVGHPLSSWLACDLDGRPHALNLATAECEPVPVASPRARAVIPRGTTAVMATIDEAGALAWWRLGESSPAAGPRPEPARVALRPGVAVSLVGGPGPDEPAATGLHVTRDDERALARLAARLRQAWQEELVIAAHTQQVAVREVLTRHLIAQARLGVLSEGRDLLELTADGRVRPVRPLFTERPVTTWTALRLGVGGRTHDVALTAEALPEIGRSLGLRSMGATPLADVLAAMDLLAPARERPTFAGQLEPGTVTSLGGHTLLANLGGAHVLVDPRFVAAERDGLPVPVAADLPDLAAILLTSDDPACLDPATLLTLDKRVPIRVPGGGDEARTARAISLLRLLGFTDPRAIRPADVLAFGDGGQAIVAPLGDGPRCAYVLRHGAACALVTGSTALDAALATQLAETCLSSAQAFGTVSPLFVDVPHRPCAAIERGWSWLLEAAERWLEPTPTRYPNLAKLAAHGGATEVIVYGDHAGLPPMAGPKARLAARYDRYRIGAGQDGWVSPRTAVD